MLRCVLSILLALQVLSVSCQGRDSIPPAWLWASGGALYAGSMIGLDALWYRDFPRSGFHSFDDAGQWLQMDKIGHAMTAYHVSDVLAKGIQLTGTSQKRAAFIGSGISLAYLTGIEVLDGFSAEWGFSWVDQASNLGGIGLFLAQDLTWQEQRIRLKYSYQPSPYAECNPDLLGSNWQERWLKDYNGQTYWLSANLHAFWPESRLPRWLNIAVGHGAQGMVTARESNHQFCETLGELPTRERVFSLSLDIDLTRIQTRSRGLNGFLAAFGFLKVPAPGISWAPSGGLRGCALCF